MNYLFMSQYSPMSSRGAIDWQNSQPVLIESTFLIMCTRNDSERKYRLAQDIFPILRRSQTAQESRHKRRACNLFVPHWSKVMTAKIPVSNDLPAPTLAA